jgi:hypothetical protein
MASNSKFLSELLDSNGDVNTANLDNLSSTLGTASTNDTGDFLQVSNNLSDLNDVSTARSSLGLAIGSDVQAQIGGTGALEIPVGTTVQRPGSPTRGMIRHNSDFDALETYDGTNWLFIVDEPLTNPVDFLVIGGGGAGGYGAYFSFPAGGGGAGGYQEFTDQEFALDTNYTITVGAGGSRGSTPMSGSNSVFGIITSAGGGAGGGTSTGATSGASGGSGGGGAGGQGGGNGNVPSTNPSQGNAGDSGVSSSGGTGGGGGGASAAGNIGKPSGTGAGGDGIASSITGTSVTRAGGGGGSGWNTPGGATSGSGGAGGGAGGASNPNIDSASHGTVNTGGGGGGGTTVSSYPGGNGGSGVVILKYSKYFTITNPNGGLTFSTASLGEFKVTTFTAGTGNIQFTI